MTGVCKFVVLSTPVKFQVSDCKSIIGGMFSFRRFCSKAKQICNGLYLGLSGYKIFLILTNKHLYQHNLS